MALQVVKLSVTGTQTVRVQGKRHQVPEGALVKHVSDGPREMVYLSVDGRIHALVARGEIPMPTHLQDIIRRRYFPTGTETEQEPSEEMLAQFARVAEFKRARAAEQRQKASEAAPGQWIDAEAITLTAMASPSTTATQRRQEDFERVRNSYRP
jgi:hypothetical protein